MKVIYELTKEDIRQVIADKYSVAFDKIEFMGQDEFMYARIDMSETETPGEAVSHELESPIVECDDILTYDRFTDDKLAECIAEGMTVVEICRKYNFSDQEKYRLYKRTEKLRSECASKRSK